MEEDKHFQFFAISRSKAAVYEFDLTEARAWEWYDVFTNSHAGLYDFCAVRNGFTGEILVKAQGKPKRMMRIAPDHPAPEECGEW